MIGGPRRGRYRQKPSRHKVDRWGRFSRFGSAATGGLGYFVRHCNAASLCPFKRLAQRLTPSERQIVVPTLAALACVRSLSNPHSAHCSASRGIVRQACSGRLSIEAVAFGSWSSVRLASASHPGYVLAGLSAFTSSAGAGFPLGSPIFAHRVREGGAQRLDQFDGRC